MVKRFRSYTQQRVKQVAKDRPKLPDGSKLNEVARILAQVDNKVHVLSRSSKGYVEEGTGKLYTVDSLQSDKFANKDHIFWIIK
jgi:hypothetical protein